MFENCGGSQMVGQIDKGEKSEDGHGKQSENGENHKDSGKVAMLLQEFCQPDFFHSSSRYYYRYR